jgi:hypothetical protein
MFIFISETPMKKLLITSLAFGSVLLAHQAAAKSPMDYSYAGVRYFDQRLDDADCSQDGLNIYGSLEINADLFAVGSVTDASGDNGCGSETISAGIGYQTLFGADGSLYGTVSYETTDVDYGDGDSGLIGAVGIRGFVARALEAKIEAAHHTAFDGNTVINGGVAYWFNQQFAATGDVSLGTDVSTVAVGLRMNF